MVAARIDELVAGDLPAAMRREIEPHVQGCARCRSELAASTALVASLRELPFSAEVSRSWARLELALELDRREQPLPWAPQVVVLATVALVVAAALVRHSAAFANRLAAPSTWQPWLLPAVFVLFGAMTAVAALPLLIAGRRGALARVR